MLWIHQPGFMARDPKELCIERTRVVDECTDSDEPVIGEQRRAHSCRTQLFIVEASQQLLPTDNATPEFIRAIRAGQPTRNADDRDVCWTYLKFIALHTILVGSEH